VAWAIIRSARIVPEPIPSYYECLPELEKALTETGSLGLLVLDASPLAIIEDEYGLDAYEEVRKRLFKIIAEQKGKDYRAGDILTLDRPRGLRFIFFLERKRRRDIPFSAVDLRAARVSSGLSSPTSPGPPSRT
jgi:hypothetical protein